MRQYCIQKLGIGEIKEIAAHHTGLNGWQYQPYNKRVGLIGDAAGLVDPLLGEGIYNAVRSGQILAQSIIEGKNDVLATISLFSKGLKEVQKDLLSCYKTSFWFYKIPAIGYATLTLPITRYFLMKGFSRGWTFSKIKTNSYNLSFWKRAIRDIHK